MGDETKKNTAVPRPPGYFQQYLARMAPTPLPPPPLPFPASTSRPVLPVAPSSASRRAARHEPGKATRKSLVDAFKQHGMKLCDGAKLNAVAKGVTHLGAVPPTLGVHITALYLSQNELRGLEGIEQFKNVRLLSVAANRLVRFADVERLKELAHLRHVNLMGNPLCDHPNYRFRVIDALRSLAVLDTVDVSKHERELAPLIASQDRALRAMVMKNHVEIQKLQRLTLWIGVLGELHCGVLRDAVTGRFDQLPTPHGDGVVNIERFLHVWRYEDALSPRERDALEAQMMAIIAKTRCKLTDETAQTKAKELLFKLANASALRRGKLNELPPAMRREHCVWEDAYAHVLQLQQQTIANLRSECDRNRQAMVEAMRELMIVNPSKRRALTMREESSPRRRSTVLHSQRVGPPPNHDAATETNLQDCVEDSRRRTTITPSASGNRCERHAPTAVDEAHTPIGVPSASSHQPVPERKDMSGRPNQLSLRRVLRSGQFGNKTLNEAIHSFSLRQPALPKPSTGRHIVRTTSASVQAYASAGYGARDSDISETFTAHETHLVSSRKSNMKNQCMRQSELDGEHDLATVTGNETVCSADTTYAPSASGFWSDCNSDSESMSNMPILVTSRAQHSRSQDKLLHQREAHPLELKTVYEEESISDSACFATHNQPHQQREGPGSGVTLPRFLTERQHELEAREEKYITALMESEQRELDLRQEISVMHVQVARFQQLLSDNEAERQRIKLEIEERASAVARPTMLRRFFVKWFHYYHWSMQVRHVQRKRRFITQHDAFWRWRRQIWARQQLRRIRTRHHMRLLRSHLSEWANLTRISVIALHTQALRQSQLVKRIVDEWRQQAHVKKLTRCMLENRGETSSQERLTATLLAWRRVVGQARQLRQLQAFYGRAATRALKQAMIRNWKVYVLTIVRPQRIKLAGFVAASVVSTKKHHFMGWREVAKSERFYQTRLRRKVWHAWWSCIQLHVNERDRARSGRVHTLKRNFLEWRRIAAGRAASRRSMNLAMRHVNHRRLRKLWMYWKIYSIARKRYMQGASKALKHYYKKLLRRTWTRWKRDARENLVAMKTKKRGELCFHFHALREGVRRSIQDKKRHIFVSHACKRRLLAHLRRTFTAWADCTKRRRRCHTLHQFLTGNRARSVTSIAWSRWKSQSLMHLRRKLVESNRHTQITAKEKMDAEHEVCVLNDRSMTLAEQVRRLTSQVHTQAKDIQLYQDELHERELQVGELEKEVDEAMQALQQAGERSQDEKQRAQAARGTFHSQVRQLEDDNHKLTARIGELEGTISDLTSALEEAKHAISSMEVRSLEAQRQYTEIENCSKEREESLRDTIGNLETRLREEQAEREETVRRLQEYEARIATTCAEISDHEQAHEQESIKLREENARLDVLQKEGAVRNAELERLLSEKNEQIIALSSKLKDAQWNDEQASQIRNQQLQAVDRGEKVGCHSSKTSSKGNKAPSVCDPTDTHISEASQGSVAMASFVCVPMKSTHTCVFVGDEGLRVESEVDITKSQVPITSVPAVPSEEERLVDERTSRIHADIQLLQERIVRRLQQVPCVPSIEQLTFTGDKKTKLAFESDGVSVSTLSESEHERDRKVVRKMEASVTDTKSRTSSLRTTGSTKLKRATYSTADRENSSRLANRAGSRTQSVPITQKPRAEPYPPHRPLVTSKTETSKPKKRSCSGRVVKGSGLSSS